MPCIHDYTSALTHLTSHDWVRVSGSGSIPTLALSRLGLPGFFLAFPLHSIASSESSSSSTLSSASDTASPLLIGLGLIFMHRGQTTENARSWGFWDWSVLIACALDYIHEIDIKLWFLLCRRSLYSFTTRYANTKSPCRQNVGENKVPAV